MYALQLAEGYVSNDDDEIKELLDGVDWYILPVTNVDGYVFTFQSVRNVFMSFTMAIHPQLAYWGNNSIGGLIYGCTDIHGT